ncbi:MAG: DUF4834 family protein [Bacteroidales bacterium]|nr:DUF4834 family protein [Bacteroidales bacterium]
MSFLSFIIILVLFLGLFIILSVLGIVRSVLSSIFSFGKHKNTYQTEPNQSYGSNSKQKSKVFEKNEGEYVDYEEVKK